MWLVGREDETLQAVWERSCNIFRQRGSARIMSVGRPGGSDLTPLIRERSLVEEALGLPERLGGAKEPESDEESECTNCRRVGRFRDLESLPRMDRLSVTWRIVRMSVEARHFSLER